MKTLKKVLSLVLVVAMIASMLIVGAAAAEETQYPEAAAVISGIKVMEGDERGMRYGDTVTREEAAAIICRLLLGNTAETLAIATTNAPFANVAATRWSAGYIAYLKGQGIISGVSATEFDPTAPVTGIAFAKMLLTAVGYGKAGEFDGAAWDINTVTFANENGIFAGTNDLILTDAATREECMLYAYNALTVPTVKYNKTFESYYTGSSALQPVTDKAELVKYSLAATKFGLTADDKNVTDVFGRPATNFYLGTELLAGPVVNAAPSFTMENAATGATLYAKLGTAASAKIKTVQQWTDGKLAAWTGKIAADDKTEIAGNGAVTEAYINGEVLTLVTVYEYIDTVSAVDAKTGVVTLAGGAKGIIPGLAKDDIVIYTKDIDGTVFQVVSATKAVPTSGTFQSVTALGHVIGGVTYVASAKISGAMPSAAVENNDFGKAYDVYTDSLGNVLLAKEQPAAGIVSNDYLYLVASVSTGAKAVGFNVVPASAQVKVVYANGGPAILNYSITQSLVDGKYYYTVPTGLKEVADGEVAAAGKWYSYVVDAEGAITLVAEAKVTTPALVVAPGKYTVGGTDARAYSKTVLNVVNEKGEVSTYTGIANFPELNKAYTTMIVTDVFGATVEVINAYAGTDGVVVEKPDVGYCAAKLYQDANGFHYSFYVNGETVEVVKATDDYVVGNAYDVTNTQYGYMVTGDYAIDKAEVVDYATMTYDDAHIITLVDDQYFVTKTGAAFYYDAFTTVYDLAAGGAVSTLTAGRAISYSIVNGVAEFIWMH